MGLKYSSRFTGIPPILKHFSGLSNIFVWNKKLARLALPRDLAPPGPVTAPPLGQAIEWAMQA